MAKHNHIRYACAEHGNMKTQCRCLSTDKATEFVPCGAWCMDYRQAVLLTRDEMRILRALVAPMEPLAMAGSIRAELDKAETALTAKRAQVW